MKKHYNKICLTSLSRTTGLIAFAFLSHLSTPALNADEISSPQKATTPGINIKTNLALHRSYEMDPPGNYHYLDDMMCTGPEDATDLTDGQRVRCRGGAIWFYKGAVGIWNLPKLLGRITIDLGKSYPIGKVRVGSSPRVPGAGVQLPPFALCLTNDKQEYFWVDRKIPKIPLPDPKAEIVGPFTELDGRGLVARYVCVAFLGPTMLDEIEVYPAETESPSIGYPVLKYEEMPKRMLFAGKRSQQDRPILAKMLNQLMDREAGGREKDYFLAWLWDIEDDYASALVRADESACQQAVVSIAALNRECVASRFPNASLLVWTANPFVTPNPLDVPDNAMTERSIHLLTGQRGIVAFNLIWIGEKEVTVKTVLQPSDPHLELRYAYRTITPVKGNRIADALVRTEKDEITLTPGAVEQLLVIVNPGFSGKEIAVKWETLTGVQKAGHILVKRSTTKLPEKFDYPIFGWDYLDWERPFATAEQIADFLKPYHISLATLTEATFRLKVDKDGNLLSQPDYTAYDRAIETQKYCQWFYASLGAKGQPQFPVGSPVWEKWYGALLKMMVGRLEQHGIKREQILLAPTDEDSRNEIWSAARKIVDRLVPGVKLFATGYLPPSDEAYMKNIDYFVCTHSPYRENKETIPAYKTKYKNVVFMQYDCGSTHDSSPYQYRFFPWENFALGIRGMGYWTREGGKETLWNAPCGYPLFYDKVNEPVELKVQEILFPSRRLEAWRAGLEDRWVLEEAQRLAFQRLRKHPNDAQARGVLQFVEDAVSHVLARPTDENAPEDAIQWLIGQLDGLVS